MTVTVFITVEIKSEYLNRAPRDGKVLKNFFEKCFFFKMSSYVKINFIILPI